MIGRTTPWVQNELLPAMIYGGKGLQGIAQTRFYKFVTSDQGLSELGIEPTEPPKLLEAYLSSFTVSVRGNTLTFRFGNVAALKAGTPHPASGTGLLEIDSWLTWILDGRSEPRGFVPRERIRGSSLSPKRIKKLESHIRLKPPLGGLMLPGKFLKSTGLWRVPSFIQNYERRWLTRNAGKIQQLLIARITVDWMKELRK